MTSFPEIHQRLTQAVNSSDPQQAIADLCTQGMGDLSDLSPDQIIELYQEFTGHVCPLLTGLSKEQRAQALGVMYNKGLWPR